MAVPPPDYPPDRLRPYIIQKDLNEPVLVAEGPFRLVGPADGQLEADLVFRWIPNARVEFDGSYEHPHVTLDAADWQLVSDREPQFEIPVVVTGVWTGSEASHIRGERTKTVRSRCGTF